MFINDHQGKYVKFTNKMNKYFHKNLCFIYFFQYYYFLTFALVIPIGNSFSYGYGIKNFQVPNSKSIPHLSTNQKAGEDDTAALRLVERFKFFVRLA